MTDFTEEVFTDLVDRCYAPADVAQARPHKPATEAEVLGAAAPAWSAQAARGRSIEQERLDWYNEVVDLAARPLRGPLEVNYLEPPEVWGKIRPHLERVLERQHRHGMTLHRLATGIQSGALKVWVWRDFEAVFLTSTYRQANGRLILNLSWTVGEGCLPFHEEILPVFEAYAHANGCHAIEATGRKGWEKTLRPYGYEMLHVTWMKEL